MKTTTGKIDGKEVSLACLSVTQYLEFIDRSQDVKPGLADARLQAWTVEQSLARAGNPIENLMDLDADIFPEVTTAFNAIMSLTVQKKVEGGEEKTNRPLPEVNSDT
jgi:hypothetical protein